MYIYIFFFLSALGLLLEHTQLFFYYWFSFRNNIFWNRDILCTVYTLAFNRRCRCCCCRCCRCCRWNPDQLVSNISFTISRHTTSKRLLQVWLRRVWRRSSRVTSCKWLELHLWFLNTSAHDNKAHFPRCYWILSFSPTPGRIWGVLLEHAHK